MASFDENGKYIKTNWKAGDKITATKLNKIEESIEAVNDNDISRHVEADARLDALEAKDVTHDKELTKVKNLIEDAKDAAELGDYEINSRMTFLEQELNEGIEEVHNVAETVDGKIATAQANMTAQVNQGKADMEAMVAEVESELDNKISIAKTPLEAADTQLQNNIDALGDELREGYLKIDGENQLEGNLIPGENGIYDIGSADNTFNNLYFKGRLFGGQDGSEEFTSMTLYRYNPYTSTQIAGNFGMNRDTHSSTTTIAPGILYNEPESNKQTSYNFSSDSLYAQNLNNFNAEPMLGNQENRWSAVWVGNSGLDVGKEDDAFKAVTLNRTMGDYVGKMTFSASSYSNTPCSGININLNDTGHSYLFTDVGFFPLNANVYDLGRGSNRWKTVYLTSNANVSSDRSLKENIEYISKTKTGLTYEDMYNFVKDDLGLATYNFIGDDKLRMNFIAQDLLVNEDGSDNKIGQMIVNPVAVPTEEEIAEGKPYPTLSYDSGMYISVLAGALKESINKIEQLEARIQELENK